MAVKLSNGDIVSSKGKLKANKEVTSKKSRVGEPYHLIGPSEEGYPLWEGFIIEDSNGVCKAKMECRYEGRRGETKIITI